MNKLRLLGVVIGTHDGWDQSGDTSFTFYDFKSEISNLKDAEFLDFNWGTGILTSFDSEGTIIWSCDMLSVLHTETIKNIRLEK